MRTGAKSGETHYVVLRNRCRPAPRGECRLPASWRVVYDAGDGRWTPVEPTADDPYPTAADEFCETRFKAVRAAKLRVEIEQRDGYSTGIHEVVLEQPNPRPAAATGDGR